MTDKARTLSRFGYFFFVLSIVGCGIPPNVVPPEPGENSMEQQVPVDQQQSSSLPATQTAPNKSAINSGKQPDNSEEKSEPPKEDETTQPENEPINEPQASSPNVAILINVAKRMVEIAHPDWNNEKVFNAYFPISKTESGKKIPGEESLKGWHYKTADGTNIYWSDDIKKNDQITNLIVIELNNAIPLKAYYRLSTGAEKNKQ